MIVGGRFEAEKAQEAVATARLRLLATTDLHLHLLPYDYYTDRPQPATGLAQLASLVRTLRAEVPEGATLLLDNGDFLSGTLMSDLLAAQDAPAAPQPGGFPPHPMVLAMNALGYDAGTLGNHEFDHGLTFLRAALAQAAFPVVSANLRAGDGPLVPPWTILDRDLPDEEGRRHRLRIGILGLAPPQVAGWSALTLGGALCTRGIVEAARAEIPRLRAAGADLVVALCHSGLGEAESEGDPQPENAGAALAAVPGLDALILGHTHEVFPDPDRPGEPEVDPAAGTVHGRPAVQPGFFGSHLGVIDLALRGGPQGWAVASHVARALPVPPEAPVDEGVAATAEPIHRLLLEVARRPVGRTRVALSSHFSLLAPDATLDVVADAQRAEARRLLQGRQEATLPILCAVSPFKAGGRAGPGNYIDILPGPLAFR